MKSGAKAEAQKKSVDSPVIDEAEKPGHWEGYEVKGNHVQNGPNVLFSCALEHSRRDALVAVHECIIGQKGHRFVGNGPHLDVLDDEGDPGRRAKVDDQANEYLHRIDDSKRVVGNLPSEHYIPRAQSIPHHRGDGVSNAEGDNEGEVGGLDENTLRRKTVRAELGGEHGEHLVGPPLRA